jgi:SAM-dependent methyltransferase
MTELKKSFDNVADEYDKYRDRYDSALISDIKNISSLQNDAVVCEIGAGTGQASIHFAADVSQLVCIEPGSNLAGKLRTNLSSFDSVTVHNSTFEDTIIEAGVFDLVFAAQSFHWVAPEIGYTKAAKILKTGGWFAAFWKRWIPTGAEAESRETKLYQEYFPDYIPVTPQQHEKDALRDLAGLVESQLFIRCQLRRYPALVTEECRAPSDRAESLRTWSRIASIERAAQDELIRRLTDIFRDGAPKRTQNETILIIGQKRG